MKDAGYVWKRAKLKGRDDDLERARRLARIRLLIENQRPDELILFADEIERCLPDGALAVKDLLSGETTGRTQGDLINSRITVEIATSCRTGRICEKVGQDI